MENTQKITETTQEVTGTLYNSLKAECDAAGIPLGTVCREAEVDRSLVQKWKKKDPKTIQVVNSLREALERLKQRNGIKFDNE